VDVTFRELEPEEGVFDFTSIVDTNYLNTWRAEGKHVVFRFICDKPSDEEHRDIPDWLYDKIDGDGTVYDTSYGKGFSPNYANEIFIEYHAKAIEALGKQFGQDTFFCYVELGSLGHWGEWHVKYEDGLIRLPGAEVREQYITPYIQAFPYAKLLMRRPFEAADTYGFGLYNDMAGHPDSTQQWLDWIENGGDYQQANETGALVPMADAWKSSPIGGEFTSSLEMEDMMKSLLSQTVNLIAATHTTFLGPKVPESSADTYADDVAYQDGVDSVLLSMGYRLGITGAQISEKSSDGVTQIQLTWTNQGVAPLYFDCPAYLYCLNSQNTVITKTKIDITLPDITPGDTVTSTTVVDYGGLESGYKLCVGIEDPLTGETTIQLVNAGDFIDTLLLLYEA
jgi:hypothetical protein